MNWEGHGKQHDTEIPLFFSFKASHIVILFIAGSSQNEVIECTILLKTVFFKVTKLTYSSVHFDHVKFFVVYSVLQNIRT